MQQVTVGTKYQIVIPKEVRKRIKGLKPGQKVKIYSADENTVSIKITQQDWVERTYGMMTDAWKGIDPIAELEKMRDEWEERLKGFEKELWSKKV